MEIDVARVLGLITREVQTAEAWMGSPDGKEFMTQSGEFWRAAHVASGVDPVSAKERSDRTIAFYRGEMPPDIAHPGTGS